MSQTRQRVTHTSTQIIVRGQTYCDVTITFNNNTRA